MKHLARVVCLLALWCVVACGGGSSTSTPTPTPTPTPTSPATLNICEASVCPWEISFGNFLVQTNLTMAPGTIFVDGPTYSVAPLGGWPQLYAQGTPGVAPAGQSQTFSLSGTLTGDSVSMLWTWTNSPNPSLWQYQLVGILDTTNNTVSGNVSFDGGAANLTFTGAERTVGLPMKYAGTLATFENSCLVSPGGQNCPSLGNDSVQVSFAMDASFNITATMVAAGVDNGTYTLSGPMIGNAMQLSGILGSQQVELVAYYDANGAYGGSAQSLIIFQSSYPISTQATLSTSGGYNGTLNPAN